MNVGGNDEGRGARTAKRLRIALRPDVVKRSCTTAVVVGSILIIINNIDNFVAGTFSTLILVKMLLTVLVPYCVSTFAAVQAISAMEARDTGTKRVVDVQATTADEHA